MSAEVVPIEEEEAVIAIRNTPGIDADAALMDWVAAKRGLTKPYHWRDRMGLRKATPPEDGAAR